jgi:hypothetical protein
MPETATRRSKLIIPRIAAMMCQGHSVQNQKAERVTNIAKISELEQNGYLFCSLK